MRNRESSLRKLEQLETSNNKLNSALNRGDINFAREIIQRIDEQLQQLKLYIETEPVSGDELNRV